MRREARAAAREALPVETTGTAPDATIREGEMEGVLQVVGEVGYRAASVRAVLEYSGSHRRQFYEHFESLEDCFARACELRIERLGVELLQAAASAPDWQSAVRAGLVGLFRFVTEQPRIARSLFVETEVAGGAAMARHEEALERLGAALDSVRAEIAPEQAPPESAAVFVVGGIEACVCEVLAEGNEKRIWDSLPELMHLAVGTYLGREAGEEAFEEAKSLLARDRLRLGGKAR
jgi:AcrR family transcriptional regulator